MTRTKFGYVPLMAEINQIKFAVLLKSIQEEFTKARIRQEQDEQTRIRIDTEYQLQKAIYNDRTNRKTTQI